MKKVGLVVLLALIIAVFFGFMNKPKGDENVDAFENSSVKFDDKVRRHTKESASEKCDMDDEVLCFVDLAVRCTISPKMKECDKKILPKFMFMDDESLTRPSFVEYRIFKVKPIDDEDIEVFTQSTCDGNWFGLCEGNIIYVVGRSNDTLMIRDIYAIE